MPTQSRASSHPLGNGERPGIPIPDPTVRTLQDSQREVHNLRELLQTQVDAIKKSSEKTEGGLILVSSDALQRERISYLQGLLEQKIVNADLQISNVREVQKAQQEGFQKLLDEMIHGRDVALAAALEAQTKSGVQLNTSNNLVASIIQQYQKEALAQQQALFTTKTQAQDKEIGELRSRLDKGEGIGVATIADRVEARSNRATQLQSGQLTTSQIAVLVSIAAIIFGILAAAHVIP